MVSNVILSNNKNIFASGSSCVAPFAMNDFSYATLPFMGMSANNYLDGDIFSTMRLFSVFMNGQMPFFMQDSFFTKNYNTSTNLASLKNVYNPELSTKLANIAEKNARARGTVGYCYRGVKDILKKADLNNGEVSGASAYQASRILANHKNFKQVNVAFNDIQKLPAGCVIVWQ